jgi:hypothetical protein
MLDDNALLALCLQVSGSFENGGGARYDSLTGNFDGQGISVGILQWNAGQGTLQTLLIKISETMGWDKMQTFFHSSIHQLALSKPADAVQFCLDHYIAEGGKNIDPTAAALWKTFLNQPESVAAQNALAQQTVLAHAKRLVGMYAASYADRNRPYAFFFDVCVQEGGMAVGHTIVPVVSGTSDVSDVMAFAQLKDPNCAAIWQANASGDDLAALLLHYAYARAKLGKPDYWWDTTSRRGTIACRGGIVHEGRIDLMDKLD